MRAYLALIKDSFREAMASKVLWILLILITFLFISLAPLGFTRQVRTHFAIDDIDNGPALVGVMLAAHANDEPSPGRRVWSLLKEEERLELSTYLEAIVERLQDEEGAPGGGRLYFKGVEDLRSALNGLLDRDDLYTEADWQGVRLTSEARDLLAKGSEISPGDEQQRLNRLLIESVEPSLFQPRPAESMKVSYLWFESGEMVQMSEKEVRDLVEKIALPFVMGIFGNFLTVFAAVLVTAPMIPRMFDAGSISLLLSKPISRSLMFLAKFIGGCAFVLLNITYLLVGLWLIAGLRYGVWNNGMLLCIPISLFLFSIYYSVSAYAGLVWKNAIVCVIVTILFWGACFMVGMSKNVVEQSILEPRRLKTIVAADDTLIGVNELSQSLRWDEAEGDWKAGFEAKRGEHIILGPIYNAARDELVAVQAFRTQGFGATFDRDPRIAVGRRAEGWRREVKDSAPNNPLALFCEADGSVVVAASGGVFRYRESKSDDGDAPQIVDAIRNLFGRSGPFESVAADPDLRFAEPVAAAASDETIAVYSRGTVMLLAKNAEGKYETKGEKLLEGDRAANALVGVGGGFVVVARADGTLVVLDANTMQTIGQHTLPDGVAARFIAAEPGGERFSILSQSRKLYFLDPHEQTLRKAPVAGQGDISAAAFRDDGALLAVDRHYRVSQYEADTLELKERIAPKMSTLEWIYRGPIVWIYTVFPKPGELGNTAQYILSQDTTVDPTFSGEMDAARIKVDPWQPVYSSLAFVAFMLAVSCIYIERSEF